MVSQNWAVVIIKIIKLMKLVLGAFKQILLNFNGFVSFNFSFILCTKFSLKIIVIQIIIYFKVFLA